MKYTVIRYQTKPGAAEKNAELIKNVFAELKAAAPEGVQYGVVRTEDGTFFHLVSYETEADQGKIPALKAFAAFQEQGRALRLAPPEFSEVTVVGNYRQLPE
jgi:hypothetical protein